MNDFRTSRTDHRLGHASMQQLDPFEGATATKVNKANTAKMSASSDGGHVNGAIAAMDRPVHGGYPGFGGRFRS